MSEQIRGTSAPRSDRGRLNVFVYNVIRERLLDGTWAAGENIGVDGLRSELGVSKQPVMEALRRLAADNLVEIVPQVGCRVPVHERKDVADFFAIFGATEGAATAISARRRSEGDIATLEELNAAIGRIPLNAPDMERAQAYRALNRRFHAAVLDMADSVFASQTSRRMWDTSDLLINTVGVARNLASEIEERHDDHVAIISAIRERDEDSARRLMCAHIERNIRMLISD